MQVENPTAFRYLFQDDLYLLENDKAAFSSPAVVPEVRLPDTETPRSAFKYLGNNKNRMLILVHYPSVDFMEPAHKAALESTLNRLNINIEDAALVNMADSKAGISEFAAFFNPAKILVHGKDALPEGISPQLNKIEQADDYRLLYTYSFAEMMTNTAYKKEFWENIKQW